MKRYIDFRNESWPDRTLSRMQEARREACLGGIQETPPGAGVIDTLPADGFLALVLEGWMFLPHTRNEPMLRRAARRQLLATLADDVDSLSPEEHTLVERMLIADGRVFLETVCEFEAARTLRFRLWCDVGVFEERPCARLDARLMDALPKLMMRREHHERRSRIFTYDGMIHGLLYMTGFLDADMPKKRFIEDVLQCAETPETLRLAGNYLEASFDCAVVAGRRLLLHEALAAPEDLVGALAAQGGRRLPDMTSEQLIGSMNGLLPEEAHADRKLRLAIAGALRPDVEADDAARELRMLNKQGAPREVLRDALVRLLCVLPTPHMESALLEMSLESPRWIAPWSGSPPSVAAAGSVGLLH